MYARHKEDVMLIAKTESCSTNVMILIAGLAEDTAPTELLLIFRNVAKEAASIELVLRSSKLLTVAMEFAVIGVSIPTR